MKKLNKKGFTLIEVIATVAILAILSVVAGVSVNKIIQNSKEEHYHNAESNMEMAGQSYVQQNRNALPKEIGQKTTIRLSQLIDKNYIEKIKDYSDNDCSTTDSYVQIFKYSQNDYSYRAYLKCDLYTSADKDKKDSPTITATVKGTDGKTNPQLEVSITDPNKLISWSYQIYKYGKEVKNSGSIALPNYDTQLNRTIDLKEYTPGKLKIVITATNIYGFTAKTTIGDKDGDEANFEDHTKPECVIAEADKESVVKPWTNTPPTIKITVGCDDKNGSGCEREEYSETFKTSTKIGTIKIKDLAGNTQNCRVSVYLDVTPPTKPDLTITGESIQTVVIKSTDAHSGMSHFEYRPLNSTEAFIPFPETGKEQITITTSEPIEIRALDKAGNISETSYTAHCNISGGTLKYDSSRGWICEKATKKVSATCSGLCNKPYCCQNGYDGNGHIELGCVRQCDNWVDCTYDCQKDGCDSGFTLAGSRCVKTADGL